MPENDEISLDSLLFDLFDFMRSAGMALTIEQCDLLRQALSQGFGLGGWDDLKRTCQLLWVKPCLNYDLKVFDRAFEQFRQQQHEERPQEETDVTPGDLEFKPLANLPQVPPRRQRTPDAQGEIEAPAAVKLPPATGLSPQGKSQFQLVPQDFPLNLADVQMTWKLLRQPVCRAGHEELDFEATLQRFEQEGVFSDVVLRPITISTAELVLMVDDEARMVPYQAALRPVFQAISEHRVTPAKIYRFIAYPDEYLYPWEHPTQAESLEHLQTQWHRDRTVVMIWSDAGATSGQFSAERVMGIRKFLQQLVACVRQVIWLNPLPPHRWKGTSAEAINGILNGQMLTYTKANISMMIQQQTTELRLRA